MRRIALLPIIAALFCACTGKTAENTRNQVYTQDTFIACTEDGTRTYAGENYSVLWHAGDRISIFSQSSANTEYMFTGEDGANAGSFTPVSEGVSSAGPFYAVYPYSAGTALNDGSICISIPATQEYARGSFGRGAGLMTAFAEDHSLRFRNALGVLVLRFYGSASVSSITVNSNGGEALAGTADIYFENGIPCVSMRQDGASESIQMHFDEPVTLAQNQATEFWFTLPPGSLENGFTATVSDTQGGSTSISTGKSVHISRNLILRMAPLALDFTAPTDVTEGSPLPPWQPGYLDIHSVNGGRGEAFYYIFPDGTTMLIDAAGAPPAELYTYGDSEGVPSKPSVDSSSGSVIVNYIRHFAPPVASGRLDYFMTSHYHGDHIGAWRDEYLDFGWTPVDKNGNPVSKVNFGNGGFILNGVAEVGMSIPMNKVLDRGDWSSRPSSDYYTSGGKKRYANYVNFLDYSARTYGTVRETLQIGHDDQIVMLHQPDKYGSFSIRTIASGGDIWTGSGTSVNTTYMPSSEECDANHEEWAIGENILSSVIHLKYGLFDWFSGGDIQFTGRSTYSWKDIEYPISLVMDKVEVMKASHHSTKNTNSAELLGVLKPDVYIAGVWRDVQPNPATLKRVYNANKSVKIFTTNLADLNVGTLRSEGIDPDSFCSTGGHVVVRVLPGGGSYYVYVLDDTDFSFTVKAVYGPYNCK